ncbi:amino acid ABC transporter permease [Aerococcus kribbianus]|uniref:Amino acid ABC transporter permease n=1 Tax=Aerococcus kribbianus TaxID=2999064 RepID=A0A9X3FU99_9LACT|nr:MULTISPECIES: amino acid ABC transporter permease [unclassified Aerococcus]MCZ0716996.1 amino acid ABC transporter permease [Aerococcus sp. YH-aer221]MCZ0725284.1 amino acid ABC transporter permease [Aerococcus sp. YH-aer222]
MDISYMVNILPQLLRYLPITIYIFILASVLGIALASLVTWLRLKHLPILHWLLEIYVSFMRATPGIIHIFLVYYGLPVLLRLVGINIGHLSRMLYTVLALVLYNGAFISEILRPAYLAVEANQREAAMSIGMTKWQANKRIIIPQMLPIALPSINNAVVDLLKDTSLLFLIGLVDIMGQAEILIAQNYGVYQLEVYLVVGLIYWLLCLVIDGAFQGLSRSWSRYL